VRARIDGAKSGSNRFQGIDFFLECFNSMNAQDRAWYALLYCAHHQLDGEYLLTFRIATKPEGDAIRAIAHRLTVADWRSLAICLGVDASLARKRVHGVFGE
jgi:hypothetical protein